MLPISPNHLNLLAHLNRQVASNDTARMAEVFRVFLEQARFGLSGLWSSDLEADNPLPQVSLSQHRQVLNWLAQRPPLPTQVSRPDVSPISLINPVANKLETPKVPHSVPLLANQAAERHAVPERLFRRMIWLESGFNPRAVSPKGAMGLGQLMPETAKELGLNLNPEGGKGSVWDPQSNLDAAARYLKWLHEKFIDKGIGTDEAWRFAAGAYNAGIGNISRALNRIEAHVTPSWERVARHLPQITGTASQETLNYVNRLQV